MSAAKIPLAVAAGLVVQLATVAACDEDAAREIEDCDSARIADDGGAVRSLTREVYVDRLIGLWLAESLANWTGLVTEGARVRPPFFTDDDWGTQQGNAAIAGSAAGKLDFNFLDPWPSDDDTDIEFIYVGAMQDAGCADLSPEQVRAAWLEHIEPGQFVWVSNRVAQGLMAQSPAVLPPSTSLLAANDQSLMIDAQLTTEIFGAMAPGMPGRALDLADLPIGVTASGYAAHAAQFYVALYSLAGVVDPEATTIEWMVEVARRVVPDGSKAADVIDFVVQDYADNPDHDDWERTRDRVASRFQLEADAHGYRYLEWYESSVNLATGLIALLYGGNDLARTIRIGALSGWDSDNGTATVGGLLGLLNGTRYVLDAFPDQRLSMLYYIGRTRVGFANDLVAFEDIAEQMIPLVEQTILEAGGSVDEQGAYALPPIDLSALSPELHNPRVRQHLTSVNNSLGSGASVSIEGGVTTHPEASDVADDAAVVDGLELDGSGTDRRLPVRDASQFPDGPIEPRCIARSSAETVTVTVEWAVAEILVGVRLVEGSGSSTGGWFDDLGVQARVDGMWSVVALRRPYRPDPSHVFEIHTLSFETPVRTDAVRISARPGGTARYFTLCELDGIKRP